MSLKVTRYKHGAVCDQNQVLCVSFLRFGNRRSYFRVFSQLVGCWTGLLPSRLQGLLQQRRQGFRTCHRNSRFNEVR
jgi:hypothetical protein